MDNHFGVAVGAKDMAERFELRDLIGAEIVAMIVQ